MSRNKGIIYVNEFDIYNDPILQDDLADYGVVLDEPAGSRRSVLAQRLSSLTYIVTSLQRVSRYL